MQAEVKTLDNADAGTVELNETVFGIEPRADILHRVVTWQLAKRRAGTHKTKQRSEIRGSGAKVWRQKGTGRARHGNKKAPIFRGGGIAFGPQPRSHETKLPKKVRALGLRCALSAKQAAGELVVLEDARLDEPKTKLLAAKLKALGWANVTIVDGAEPDENLIRASRNIIGVRVLPSQGANVYDILRRDTLALTKSAIEQLEARLA